MNRIAGLALRPRTISLLTNEHLVQKTQKYIEFHSNIKNLRQTYNYFDKGIHSTVGELGMISSCMMNPIAYNTQGKHDNWYTLQYNVQQESDAMLKIGEENFMNQSLFYKKLINMTKVVDVNKMLKTFIARYGIFLELLHQKENISPPFDVDVVWHSHLLDNKGYDKFCQNYFDRKINHIIHTPNSNRPWEQTNDNSKQIWNQYVDSLNLDSDIKRQFNYSIIPSRNDDDDDDMLIYYWLFMSDSGSEPRRHKDDDDDDDDIYIPNYQYRSTNTTTNTYIDNNNTYTETEWSSSSSSCSSSSCSSCGGCGGGD